MNEQDNVVQFPIKREKERPAIGQEAATSIRPNLEISQELRDQLRAEKRKEYGYE